MCLKGDEESYHLAISDAQEVFLVKVVGAAAQGNGWERVGQEQPARTNGGSGRCAGKG